MEYLKKNWLNIISLLVGVLGIISSYYFYSISYEEKEPTIIEGQNTLIFSPSFRGSAQQFSLVDNVTDVKISKNVYLQELYFWNKGRETIRNSDILSPITLFYSDGSQIIDVQVVESTRPSIVKAEAQSKADKVELGFSILEENDGFKVQVVYAADESQVSKIGGDIEGVGKFYQVADLTTEKMYFGVGKLIFYIFLFLAGLLGLSLILHLFEKMLQKLAPTNYQKIKETVLNALGMIGFGLFLAFVIGMFISLAVDFAKSEGKSTVPVMEVIESQNQNAT